jgi:hypothetical protein
VATDPGPTGCNIVVQNLTDGSQDYHLQDLAVNRNDAEDAGIGPSSDANVPTSDIDGDSRSGTTCDMGADEI